MKLTINIQDDERLRNEVRNLIEGQIRSLTREETAKIIVDEMMRRIGDNVTFRELVQKAINQQIQNWITPVKVFDLIREAIPAILSEKIHGLNMKRENITSIIETDDEFLKGLFLEEFQRLLYSKPEKK